MRKEKGEDSSEIDIVKLCKETLARIKHHRQKNNTTDIEFYETFKDFFTTYMHFDYEFSVQDLEEKIEKIYFNDTLKEHLRRLTSKAEVIEYKDDPYTRDQLNDLFDDFRVVIEKILDSHKKQKSWFSNLFGWFKKDKKHIMPKAHKEKHEKHDKRLEKEQVSNENDEMPKPREKKHVKETVKKTSKISKKETEEDMPKPKKEIQKNKNAKKPENKKQKKKLSFEQKLDEALKLKDKEKLQLLYNNLLEEYNDLSDEKQNKYYDKLEKLYEKLTS